MKKILFVLSIFLIFMITDVVHAESGMELDGSTVFDSSLKEVYFASGKKLEFTIEGYTSEFTWGSGSEAVLVQKERVKSLKVTITNSSGVSCTLKNLKSTYYDLNGNTFTLKNNNTATSNISGNIAGISCTLPTASKYTKLSASNYLTIVTETTDIDIAPETPTTKTTTKTYKYRFGIINESYIKSLNNNSSLTSVKVDGKDPSFKTNDTDNASVTLSITQNGYASKNKLYLEVESENKGIVIKNQVVKAGNTTINLPYGLNSIEVEERTEREEVIDTIFGDYFYDTIGFSDGLFNTSHNDMNVFLFNRKDNRSKVNTLKTLAISGATIAFKPDLKTYAVTVPYKVSSVAITSTLTDSKSSYVKDFGNRTVNLKEGLNTVLVKVQAENESVATYTLKITRDKNDDSSLKSITVNDKSIAVKKGLLVYSINVDNKVVKPTIKAVPTDGNAKVAIDKIDNLAEGNNEINITVTASNGNKSVYVINVIRDTLISTNSKLKKLEIKDQDITFEQDKTEYTVHIGPDVDKLDLVIEPDHQKAKYIITGNKDLKNGSVIKIKVTAEDGKTITNYTINVEKEKSPLNMLFVIIPAGALLVIGFIALIVKVAKKKPVAASPSISEPVPNLMTSEPIQTLVPSESTPEPTPTVVPGEPEQSPVSSESEPDHFFDEPEQSSIPSEPVNNTISNSPGLHPVSNEPAPAPVYNNPGQAPVSNSPGLHPVSSGTETTPIDNSNQYNG